MELRGGMFGCAFAPEDGGAGDVRLEDADEDTGFPRGGRAVRAENGKWVGMLAAND